MSAHTKGPWEYGNLYYPEDDRQGECNISPVGEFGILAKVVLPRKPFSGFPEGPANARLIAASPDLLAALRGLMAIAAPHMTDDPQRAAMEQASAAVAKAEGHSP